MHYSLSRTLRATIAATLLFVLPCLAQAQDRIRPIAVVAVNNLNEIFGDIATMTELAGQGDAGKVAIGMGGIYTTGIDRTKPAGAYVTLGDTGPKVIAFIPVTNLKQLLAVYREQIGTPADKGNGVWEIGGNNPQPVYVKEQSGYAFISQDSANLVSLPDDPAKILGGLEKKYDLSVQLNLQNIPAEVRDLAVSQMKLGFDQAMAQQNRNLGPDERRVAEELGRSFLQGAVDFIEQADQLTVGFAMDSKAKTTFLELSLTAVPNSDLAKQIGGYSETTTSFGGLAIDDAAALLQMTTPLLEADVKQMQSLIKLARDSALKSIEDDPSIPTADARKSLKEVVTTVMEVLDATISRRKLDGGAAALVGQKGIDLVAGAFVADGKALEGAVKKAVALLQANAAGANIPEIKLDVGSYGGVTFHSVAVPTNDLDANARRAFGDNPKLLIGFGKESVYLALGADSIPVLKKVIDKSATPAAAPPMQMRISVAPLLKFAASVDPNPRTQVMADAANKAAGNDRITVNLKSTERGMVYRLEVNGGVLQIAGEATKAAQESR